MCQHRFHHNFPFPGRIFQNPIMDMGLFVINKQFRLLAIPEEAVEYFKFA